MPPAGASAAHITAVIPHFAYARSDKKDAPRISIGARLVADMLATAGATRVLTMALHAPQVHGFFSVPVDHLNAVNVLADHFRGGDLSNTRGGLAGPGQRQDGHRVRPAADVPVAAGSKRRLTDDTVVIDRIVGDVHDRDVIVLDDEIATAGSIVELLRKLRADGVREISLACTHGLSPARRSSGSSRSRTSPRSWPPTRCRCRPDKRLPNMVSRSVAPLFAEAVKRIHFGESVSSLFSDEETYG